MPRLLLVDDNPSIHRIAESLLAPTDVDLVCVDSAAEALDRLARGERFDVALVDTAMPGMDGWTLLARLRAMEETAHLPIALMAGVLDPVDPAKLAKAPVQGFLKKPIELRELGDRVKALLATPVTTAPEPSPFSTVPATPARDLVRMAEEPLPEFRPAPEVPALPVEAPGTPEALSEEEDLLVLTAEDLWPEEPAPIPEPPALAEAPAPALEAPAASQTPPEVQLDLEELDLDSLQDLAAEPAATLPVAEAPVPEPQAQAPEPVAFGDLEDLGPLPGDLDLPVLPEPLPEPEAVWPLPPEPLAGPDEEALPGSSGFDAPPAFNPAEAPEIFVPAATGQALAAPGQGTTAPESAQAVVQALLADPVLVDALVKAVVARMGDQVIREIAWEVMPDLAGKLPK